MKLRFLFSLVLCFGVISALNSCSEEANAQPGDRVFEAVSSATGSVDMGNVDFAWTDDGQTVNYKDYVTGKKHVVNIWGTWCPPCRKELPDLVEFSKSNADIPVIGIALERSENPIEGLQAFCKDNGLSYLNVTGSREVMQQLVQQFGNIQAVPTTLFFNSDGSLSATKTGQANLAEFNKYAAELH